MTTSEKEDLVRSLKSALAESERMWNSPNKSHAFIIGYLEGFIKGVVDHLEESPITTPLKPGPRCW